MTLTGVDDVDADVVAHPQRQHALLSEQADRLKDTVKAAEELVNAHRKGGGATPRPGGSRSSGLRP